MDSPAPTTDMTSAASATSVASAPSSVVEPVVEPVVDDMLVEDVSIDGMCGVY